MAVTARCDQTELLVDQCSCPDHRGAPTARRETVLVGLVGEPSDPTMVHRLDFSHHADPESHARAGGTPTTRCGPMSAAAAHPMVNTIDLAVCLSCKPDVVEQPGRRQRIR